jgi:hypothetical protein
MKTIISKTVFLGLLIFGFNGYAQEIASVGGRAGAKKIESADQTQDTETKTVGTQQAARPVQAKAAVKQQPAVATKPVAKPVAATKATTTAKPVQTKKYTKAKPVAAPVASKK